MPTGSMKTLRKVEVGKETTKGTAGGATELLYAQAEIDPDGYEVARGESSIGTMVKNAGPVALVKKGVSGRLRTDPNVGATYQQLAWWLALALDQPTSVAGPPPVHTFDPGTAAPWNPHSATGRFRWTDGVTNEDLRCQYLTGSRLRLRGERSGALQAELEFFAREQVDEAISAAALPAILTPILLGEAKVYINDTFALADIHVPAAGLLANQFKSFDLDIDVGQFPDWTIDGALTFSEAKEREKSFTLGMTLLYEPNSAVAGVAAERVKAASTTQPKPMRFVTIAFTGPGNMKLRLVVAGHHERGEIGPPKADIDGLDSVEVPIVGHHDPTGAVLVKAVITNDDAAAL